MKGGTTLLLILGTLAVSSAAVFIVLSGVDPAAIAVWRLGITALVFLPLALPRLIPELKRLGPRAGLALVIGGITFGMHFVFFNTGFQRTSYESTVVLLAAQPLMAAVLGYLFLREKVTWRMGLSIAVGSAGLMILVWNDYTFKPEHLPGDAIVLACGLAIVITYVFARRLRQALSFPVYVATLYSVGAITAGVYLLADGQRLLTSEFGRSGWIALGLLVLVCTIVGHTLFNFMVKWVPLFYINIVIIAEPVIAIALKFALRSRFEAFQDSTLSNLQVLGGSVLFAGILLGLTAGQGDAPTDGQAESGPTSRP